MSQHHPALNTQFNAPLWAAMGIITLMTTLAMLAGWNAGWSIVAILPMLIPAALGLWLLLGVAGKLSTLAALISRGAQVTMTAAQGDLNVRLTRIGRHDELGELMHGINRILDLTEEFAKDTGAAMLRAGRQEYFRIIPEEGLRGDYLTYARLINKVLGDMERRDQETTQFEQSVKEMVAEVAKSTEGIHKTAHLMADRSERAGGRTLTMGTAAEESRDRAESVSGVTGELVQSIDEIAEQANMANSVAQKARTDIGLTADKVRQLADSVQEIGQVVQLISDIAAQTNLLALNATIEAARAGDAGKGFNVVAHEVKSLAGQTSKATEDISRQVSTIQSAASLAVAGINDVVKTIYQVDEISSAIASAVQEQEAATRDISTHVDELAAKAIDVSTCVAEVARASSQACGGTVRVIWSATALSKVVNALSHRVEEYIGKVRAG